MFIILVRKNVNGICIEVDFEKAKKIRVNDEENNRKLYADLYAWNIEYFSKSRQIQTYRQNTNGSIKIKQIYRF